MDDGHARAVDGHNADKGRDPVGQGIGQGRQGVEQHPNQQKATSAPAVGRASDERQQHGPGCGMDAEQQARSQAAQPELTDVHGNKGHHHAVSQHGGKHRPGQNEDRAFVRAV